MADTTAVFMGGERAKIAGTGTIEEQAQRIMAAGGNVLDLIKWTNDPKRVSVPTPPKKIIPMPIILPEPQPPSGKLYPEPPVRPSGAIGWNPKTGEWLYGGYNPPRPSSPVKHTLTLKPLESVSTTTPEYPTIDRTVLVPVKLPSNWDPSLYRMMDWAIENHEPALYSAVVSGDAAGMTKFFSDSAAKMMKTPDSYWDEPSWSQKAASMGSKGLLKPVIAGPLSGDQLKKVQAILKASKGKPITHGIIGQEMVGTSAGPTAGGTPLPEVKTGLRWVGKPMVAFGAASAGIPRISQTKGVR